MLASLYAAETEKSVKEEILRALYIQRNAKDADRSGLGKGKAIRN